MTRSEFTANRLREVLLDGRWIANTNYKEQIEGVTWKQAIERVGTLNTIAVLTFHVNYYLSGILNVFNGGGLEIRDKYSFDMPSIQSEADWHYLVADFVANAEKFVGHVAEIPDKRLDEPFVDEKYGTYWRNMEGVVEHCYYHLGQISLIKKLVTERSA